MQRIHTREILSNNYSAYYTAIEHMINNSKAKDVLLSLLPFVFNEDQYEIEIIKNKKTKRTY